MDFFEGILFENIGGSFAMQDRCIKIVLRPAIGIASIVRSI
jgi:hypothetical protein